MWKGRIPLDSYDSCILFDIFAVSLLFFFQTTELSSCAAVRIANNDIKDKSSLVDARKAIEREMERFKICEKEAKTKAFSKAGLGLQTKLDPEEKARQEARDWLNEQVEALQIQV